MQDNVQASTRQVVVARGMQIGNCNFWPEQGAGEMMGDTFSPCTIGIA